MPPIEQWVWLRLKLLADVGLVGMPNAGKSTFINKLSNANAKVGDYAFTTLRPQLGVVMHKHREFVVADIPGLIAGAADGAGIGDRFLGHIERCRVLVHLIDISNADPVESMQIVEEELEAYSDLLADKPRLVALNKIDLVDDALAAEYAKLLLKGGATEVFPISGATGKGMSKLQDAIIDYLPAATVTERPAGEREEADDTPWSPI
jgi:GTP-binding protein